MMRRKSSKEAGLVATVYIYICIYIYVFYEYVCSIQNNIGDFEEKTSRTWAMGVVKYQICDWDSNRTTQQCTIYF